MGSFGKQWAHDHFGFVHSAKWLLLTLFQGILLRQDAECSKVVFTKINLLNFGEPLGQKKERKLPIKCGSNYISLQTRVDKFLMFVPLFTCANLYLDSMSGIGN